MNTLESWLQDRFGIIQAPTGQIQRRFDLTKLWRKDAEHLHGSKLCHANAIAEREELLAVEDFAFEEQASEVFAVFHGLDSS